MTETDIANLVTTVVAIIGMIFCLITGYIIGRIDEARERESHE